jgi:HAD superfamily hydrolase (TIGR01490 family)
MALAIFDLDNTLIAGDSDHGWGEFLVTQGKVDSHHYKAVNDRFYADYEAGCLDIYAYLEFSLEPLARIPSAELQQLHQAFMREVIAPMMLGKAQDLIERHRRSGDRLLVITSTNRFVVEPICAALGIEELIATDPEIIDGAYSGQIVGAPTYREGKVTRFKQWLCDHREHSRGSYFYSDSINDLPMLLEVTHPVAVDPDPELREEALTRGWDIISLRD